MPSTDTFIEKDSAINEHIEQMRLSATKALIERRDAIIVSTVSAIYGLGDPGEYHRMVLHLVRGDRIDQRDLGTEMLEDIGGRHVERAGDIGDRHRDEAPLAKQHLRHGENVFPRFLGLASWPSCHLFPAGLSPIPLFSDASA
jgi:hypothetical protein